MERATLSDLNILLIRHGESEANVDLSVYENKHDCEINLTKKRKTTSQRNR